MDVERWSARDWVGTGGTKDRVAALLDHRIL
jgi:hypothetical protein